MSKELAIGFTGTRYGMSKFQVITVEKLLKGLSPTIVHHGDDQGSDLAFDIIAFKLNIPRHVHPPTNTKRSAGIQAEQMSAPKPYLARNKDIVRECDILLAAPKSNKEVLRSGTWATIREAHRQNKKVITVWPNGEYKIWER